MDLVKASLDSFDGLAPRLLDGPDTESLLNSLPSGFAATLLARCLDLEELASVIDLPGCAGAAVSADVLGEDLVVFYGLVSFENQELASAALEMALERIETGAGLPFGDVAAGQLGDLVWTKVLVDPEQVAQALRALLVPKQ